MPWATDSQTDAEATELIETFIAQYAALENFVMSIWSPDESTLLGGCGFHLREGPLSTRSVESGMWIRSDAAGQGLGSAVLLELITWGFTEWPWLRIAWKCNTTNTASIRCAEKAGLVWEGTLRGQFDEATGGRRDTACYAILKGA
jgi:RimJ/RimL family protein N-acetyltransferase